MNDEIDIRHDYVTAFGVKVLRPKHISPSEWLNFWEQATDIRGGYQEGYDAGWDERGWEDA